MTRRAAPSRRSCAGTAMTSSRLATPPAATAAWEAHRPDLIVLDLGLPDRDGLAVIRHDPARGDHADPRPVGARSRRGQGRGPRPWRRRLRHQAVRDGRAPRPDRRPAPSRGRSGRRRRRGRPHRRPDPRCGTPPRDRRRPTGAPDTARVRGPQGAASPTPVGWSPTGVCCAPSGAPPTATRRTTSTSTSARSGASSRPPTRPGRCAGLIVAEPGVGYRIRPSLSGP